MTAPRFLGYQFNPVSFWYLYGLDRRLQAMILEVNNTFDERRMYFLSSEQADSPPAGEEEQGKCSRRSRSRQHIFRQSWPKDFHVSPFNSRKGSYTLTATDPLDPSMQGTGPVSVAIKLVSSKGHPKMVAALSSQGAAMDPCTMTSSQQFRFLASWWWVGLLTYPRILQQALGLFFHRRLHVWHKPDPLPGTISRRATRTEQHLEPIFRRYLQHLVDHAPARLAVEYTPAAGITPQLIQPKKAHPSTALAEQVLAITVLTPAFYHRFTRHANPLDGFLSEEARNDSSSASAISVSRADLLPTLALGAGQQQQPTPLPPAAARGSSLAVWACLVVMRRLLLHCGPGGGGLSAVDKYVLAHEPVGVVAGYGWCVLRLVLADKVLLRVGAAWVVGLGLEGVCLGVCWFLRAVGGLVGAGRY